MLATSGAFATAVAGVEYYGAWRVQITLPAAASAYQDVTLAVSAVQVTAATTTDMPEGSRLEVGYPAIGCDFTVSGLVDRADASKTAGWLFGPYSTTSPLYRSDALYAVVTVDFGIYTSSSGGTPEWVRKFTGVVDSYSVGEDGAVTFTCVDAMRAKLRSVPALPAVITAPPYNAGLTSEFAIDALLRAATGGAVSSWPARRSGCVLAAGLRSSLWAEIGVLDTSDYQPVPTFQPGPFGTGLTQINTTRTSIQFVVYKTTATLGTDIYLELLVSGLLPAGTWTTEINVGNSTNDEMVSLFLGQNHAQVLWQDAAAHFGSFTFTPGNLDSSTRLVGLSFHMAAGSTSWSATLSVDGVTASTGAQTASGARTSAVYDTVFIWPPSPAVGGTVAIAGLQVTTESGPTSSYPFTPLAVLDPSLNSLTVVPEIAAGDPSGVVQQIADAELAHAGGDESGTFRFYNRNTIRAVNSVRDITSATSLTGVGNAEIAAAGVINRATVEYAPWSFATANTTIWSATAAIRVTKASTKTLTVTSDGLFASVSGTFTVLANNSTSVTTSHYRASTDKYGTSEHPGVTITAVQTSPTTAVLTMVNATNKDAWLVSPANYTDAAAYPVGTPVLQLAGVVVTQGETLTQDVQYPPAANGAAASSRFGEQATQISGNPWLQDDDTALVLATDIVVDQVNPRPNLTSVAIVPDPRIQLIDVGHLVDPDRTGIDEYVRVFGWSITWEAASDATSPMRYDMTLDARTIAAPGGWIMGIAGRSEIGSTAYVYPSI